MSSLWSGRAPHTQKIKHLKKVGNSRKVLGNDVQSTSIYDISVQTAAGELKLICHIMKNHLGRVDSYPANMEMSGCELRDVRSHSANKMICVVP